MAAMPKLIRWLIGNAIAPIKRELPEYEVVTSLGSALHQKSSKFSTMMAMPKVRTSEAEVRSFVLRAVSLITVRSMMSPRMNNAAMTTGNETKGSTLKRVSSQYVM